MADLPNRVRLVIFDLDGVIYRGAEAVRGAPELVAWLHDVGVPVRFATNNSMVTRDAYVERLGAIGIATDVEEIVTSTSATVDHLAQHAPGVRSVLTIGADGMRRELETAGLEVTAAADVHPRLPGGPLDRHFDAVVVGLDPSVSYDSLSSAMAAVADGARLIATNADSRYPTPAGFLPGAGAIVAALATATGVTPEVIGKPEPAMFRSIIEACGLPAADCVVIGDNPEADVAGAHRAGCASILVLTGVADSSTVASLAGERRPDAVAAGPSEVRRLLEGRVS